MKFSLASSLLAFALTDAAPAELEKRATVQGFDISNYQPNVDFRAAYNSGARFVIIKVSLTTIRVSLLSICCCLLWWMSLSLLKVSITEKQFSRLPKAPVILVRVSQIITPVPQTQD